MSSEEMRIELERFVNTGLQEGWTGWPLKADGCDMDGLTGQWVAAPGDEWLGGCDAWLCPTGRADTFISLHSLC